MRIKLFDRFSRVEYSWLALAASALSIFGTVLEWTNFNKIIPHFGSKRIVNKSLISSNFVASLELAKNGFIEMKQNETFGNIYVRSKQK